MDSHAFSPATVATRLAAEWVARRDRGLSAAEEAELLAWLAADPAHLAAWDRAAQTWTRLDSLASVTELDAMADVVIARARARKVQRQRWRIRILATAAAVALGFAGWSRLRPESKTVPAAAEFATVQIVDSTLRRVALPDGSIAELNGNSQIEVNYTAKERRVRLVDGEGHFVVAKNPERPFFVSAGAVTVRAVGTAFNVRLASSAIEVLVTEGKVQVQPAASSSRDVAAATAAPNVAADSLPPPAALVAGQRAVIEVASANAPGTVAIGEVPRAEIDEALSWQTTRLVFNNTPLDEVVASFNRYNAHQLTLGDAKLRQRKLTGTFRSDNLDGFVRLLRVSVDVKAELRTSLETVLLPMH